MKGIRNRLLGGLIASSMLVATTAAADQLPTADELAAMEAQQQASGEADEAVEELILDDEADEPVADEATDEGEAPLYPEGWETSLRDPISPVMSTEGTLGFHGITSAISPGPFTFQVGLLGRATRGRDFIRFGDAHRALAANVVVNASFLDHFGVHFGLEARNSLNSFGQPQSMIAQGDLNFGFMGRYPVADGIWLGGDLSFFAPSGFDSVGMAPGGTSVRPRLLASFDVDKIAGAEPARYIPLIAHLNLGYRIDNSERLVPEGFEPNRIERHAYGLSAYNMLEFGVGFEAPLPYITPFLGYNAGIPVRGSEGICDSGRALRCVSDVGGASYPQSLSLGAKGEPVENLGLHLGIDIGLTGAHAEGLPVTLPYEFNFGVSWQIDPLARQVEIEQTEVEVEIEVEPPRGFLFGQVVDQTTGEPIPGVRISYLDQPFSDQLTDDDAGIFESYGFEPGREIVVDFSHAAYEPYREIWTVEEGTSEFEFAMEPLPREAVLTGQVIAHDEEGEPQPVAGAVIVIVADDGAVYQADADGQGRFEQPVTAAAMSLAAVYEGHISRGAYVAPDADESLDLTLELVPFEGERLAEVAGNQIGLNASIEFEGTSATILEESYDLLDHIASAILAEPQASTLRIVGHTDDSGDPDELLVLSRDRAEAVADALTERGVSPQRIEADGYGSARPLVPNTSSRNRNLNRRIEFEFVD